MRLSSRQIRTLKNAVNRHFGPATQIWLFGSRVNDALRGGDYDFYLETEVTDPAEIIDRKLKLLADLHASPEFENEKIDLVIRSLTERQTDTELPIYRVTRCDGVRL